MQWKGDDGGDEDLAPVMTWAEALCMEWAMREETGEQKALPELDGAGHLGGLDGTHNLMGPSGMGFGGDLSAHSLCQAFYQLQV